MDGLSGAQGRFQALHEAYAAHLPSKIGRLRELWASLDGGAWDATVARTLHRMAHSLAGSGATLGYPEVSRIAGELEEALKACPGDGSLPGGDLRARIAAALGELAERGSSAPGPAPEPEAALPTPAARRDRNLLLLMGTDESLAHQIEHFGYQVRALPDFASLGPALAQARPGALIVDAARGGAAQAAWEVSLLRRQGALDVPLLFISNEDDVIARLQAVHAGGQGYFSRPVDIGWLVDKLDELTGRIPEEAPRVLLVEDDSLLAARYALALEQAGMATRIVTDPLRVLEPLSQFRPDLILMDLYMPECTGLELAAVIRQDEEFVRIPIVFLSTERRLDKALEAMRTGGDDFLHKPIPAEHLVSAIDARVRRSRTLRAMMERDSLTRLFNHTQIRTQLEVELSRARRQGGRVSYALLDLDHFKNVNDTHGHRAGDRVLKGLARLLRQRFRNTDIVGRYGGEEFVVIMTDLDASGAALLMDGVRATFEKVRHVGRDVFTATFSAGVADFPAYATGMDLQEAADRALYRAKRTGRNQVVIASDADGQDPASRP